MKKLLIIIFLLLSCTNRSPEIEAKKLGQGLKPKIKVTAVSCFGGHDGCEGAGKCTVSYEDESVVTLLCNSSGCTL